MKLEVKSVNAVTFAMVLGIPGSLLGLLGSGLAAFVYPFQSTGVAALVGTVLVGTAAGALLGFVLGFVAAWSYNTFAGLIGGLKLDMQETEKDE